MLYWIDFTNLATKKGAETESQLSTQFFYTNFYMRNQTTDFYTNYAILTRLSYYRRKIKQFCVKTRENTKVPSNQNASPKLQTERSGGLRKGRSLQCCRDQAPGDCHALPRDCLLCLTHVTSDTSQGLVLQSQVTLLVDQIKESYERQCSGNFLWSAIRIHNSPINLRRAGWLPGCKGQTHAIPNPFSDAAKIAPG